MLASGMLAFFTSRLMCILHMHADAVQLQVDSSVDYTFNGATV